MRGSEHHINPVMALLQSTLRRTILELVSPLGKQHRMSRSPRVQQDQLPRPPLPLLPLHHRLQPFILLQNPPP